MTVLEQRYERPRWQQALEVALARPPGVPERRTGDDPWHPDGAERPRRVADDLAWLRQAMDDPGAGGLRPVDEDLASLWQAGGDEVSERLERLHARGVLQAAGFVLHRGDQTAA